ncbi:MAG: phosphate ABC transporter permease PstA [Gammaproteobacteria bacterium]
MTGLRNWFASGTPYIWLNAGAVTVSLVMVFGLIALIAVRGLSHFWPASVAAFDYKEANGDITTMLGEIADRETVSASRASARATEASEDGMVTRLLIKRGNRDYTGLDFQWIEKVGMENLEYPQAAIVVERREWGNFYGYLKSVKSADGTVISGDDRWQVFQENIERSLSIHEEIRHIEKDLIGGINYQMEQLRLNERSLELDNVTDPAAYQVLDDKRAELQEEYNSYEEDLRDLYQEFNKGSFVATLANGKEVEISFAKVVRGYKPNAMSWLEKCGFYAAKFWEFVSDEPREANTEGGIFPAIFGTVLMVMIMAVLVTPFGVLAAVYLREYAQQGFLTRTIRIAVNNLAGVPSIVYGVFGLGFFVYFLGGSIDKLFYPEALPAPTFGTPGLMWASLTLAILTVPVVIVATEEGLSRVPRTIREGSLALGATKAETLWRTVLPMTASAMITGLILAVARAAGEVAPLMLVGVVKLAPSLALDGNAPVLHLDRKFMHLGFHIYDVGFQSPNVEAARPLVYATAFLLVVIIIVLNLTAIRIRNRLREKYRAAEQH